MILASIIIPTKNGEKYLNEVLTSIYSQSIKNIEIIIIDSGSTDKTLKIVKKYPVKLKQILSHEFDHGGTRNLGAKIARGKYIVYLTQDATPANKYWLKNLLSAYEKDKLIVGSYSRHIPRKSCNPLLKRQITQVWPTGSQTPLIIKKSDLQKYKNDLPRIIHFSDSSSVILREIILKYPFPKTRFAEDIQWEIKVLKAGYKVEYSPQSVIYHSHDYPLIEQIRQNYDHMRTVKGILLDKIEDNLNCRVFSIKKVLEIFYQDFYFVLFNPEYNFFQKLKWILYSPFWHSAIYMGTFLGINDNKIPNIIRKYLSRQERIQQQ